MKRGMTIEYLKCRALRADLSFEIDFGVNGVIGAIVTKWDLILFGCWIVFIHNIIYFFNTLHVYLYIKSLLKSTNTKEITNIYTRADGSPHYC